MKILILAGGTGTRLRPVSTQTSPKQFLKVDGEVSMLQMTVERVLSLVQTPKDILISTHIDYVDLILNDLSWYDISRDQIITEPAKKNTWPAIALAIAYLYEHYQANDDEIVLSVHADQIIAPNQTFVAYVKGAMELASQWNIVTFGINPTAPETWYGYIQVDMTHVGEFGQPIQQFVEKPDMETAKAYIASGNYYRNSGTFMFPLKKTVEELRTHTPELAGYIDKGYTNFYDTYADVSSIAIDVALMEQTTIWYVVPMHIQWSDVGSRDSMYAIGTKDASENVVSWDVTLQNVHGSLVRSTTTPIKINDIDNILVVEDEAGIYITKKSKSQWVKKLLG